MANIHPFRSWSPSSLDFRLACEECHKRKIRCKPSTDGNKGSCEACHHHHRQCLFSLKNQVGRPRKDSTTRTTPGNLPNSSPPHSALEVWEDDISASSEHHGPDFAPGLYEPAALPGWTHDGFTQLVERSSGRDLSHDPHTEGTYWGMTGPEQAWLTSTMRNYDSTTSPATFPMRTTPQDNPTLPNNDYFQDMIPRMFARHPSLAASDTSDHLGMSNGQSERSSAILTATSSDSTSTTSTLLATESTMPKLELNTDTRSKAHGLQTSRSRDYDQNFEKSIGLCTAIHQRSQAKPLNLLSDADQQDLGLLLHTINELGHMASVLRRQVTQTNTERQDNHQLMIVHVAVEKAMDIAAELIRFNLEASEGHFQSGSKCIMVASGSIALTETAEELQADDQAGMADCGKGCDSGSSSSSGLPGQYNIHLESVLSLSRLDYSLSQFRLFLLAHGFTQRRTSPITKGKKPHVGSENSLARIDSVRERCRVLSEKLRSL